MRQQQAYFSPYVLIYRQLIGYLKRIRIISSDGLKRRLPSAARKIIIGCHRPLKQVMFMAAMQIENTQISTRIAGVRFQKLGKLYHFDCSEFPEVVSGDYVIVETARGRQMGQVMGFI